MYIRPISKLRYINPISINLNRILRIRPKSLIEALEFPSQGPTRNDVDVSEFCQGGEKLSTRACRAWAICTNYCSRYGKMLVKGWAYIHTDRCAKDCTWGTCVE